jgi:hypothetical protein
MTDKDQTQIAGALKTALISPNEPDRAGEKLTTTTTLGTCCMQD